MDFLIALFVIYSVVMSIKKSVKGNQAKRVNRGDWKSATRRAMWGEDEQSTSAVQSEQPKAAPAKVETVFEGMSFEGIERREDYQPLAPRVDSIGLLSSEGNDYCDPSLGHDRPKREEIPNAYEIASEGTSLFDSSPKAIMQGIVMSEILSRPNPNRWRKR